MKQLFEQIYANNSWGPYGSGEGSLLRNTKGYASFLQTFFRKHRISSVADFGCGDWQFSRSINWGDIEYRGYDIVSSVIAENRHRYQTGRISFHEIEPPYDDFPPADLLIAKDVFQHWSDEAIFAFLPVLAKFRYSLITNCVDPAGKAENQSTVDGGFRYLDLRLRPFLVPAREVFSFTNHRSLRNRIFGKPVFLKKVLLVTSEQLRSKLI
jgi:hypothetical protein